MPRTAVGDDDAKAVDVVAACHWKYLRVVGQNPDDDDDELDDSVEVSGRWISGRPVIFVRRRVAFTPWAVPLIDDVAW